MFNDFKKCLFFLTEPVVRFVRINFRNIRHLLHFDITADNLIQAGIIDFDQRHHDGRLWRGKLVKESIKKGAEGCEILMRTLKLQNIDIFDYCVETRREKKVGKNITRANIRKGERRNNCRIT